MVSATKPRYGQGARVEADFQVPSQSEKATMLVEAPSVEDSPKGARKLSDPDRRILLDELTRLRSRGIIIRAEDAPSVERALDDDGRFRVINMDVNAADPYEELVRALEESFPGKIDRKKLDGCFGDILLEKLLEQLDAKQKIIIKFTLDQVYGEGSAVYNFCFSALKNASLLGLIERIKFLLIKEKGAKFDVYSDPLNEMDMLKPNINAAYEKKASEGSAERNMAAKSFGRNDYDYSRPGESIEEVISALSKGDQIVEGRLRKALEKGGGKAFGLVACEIVAKECPNMDVPKWQVFDIGQLGEYLEREKGGEKMIIRSSSFNPVEDWGSAESGALKSHDFHDATASKDGYNYYSSASLEERTALTRDNLDLYNKKDVGWVLQERVEGIGLVVDVAYSELSARPVVRIASGRQEKKIYYNTGGTETVYTSAVSDLNADVSVFTAATGTPIVGKNEYSRGNIKSIFGKEVGFRADNFAFELHRALKRSGINFGVQCEVIINPSDPNRWHLVQVRPSPEVVRGELDKRELTEILQNTEELCTTAVVSGPFIHRGRATKITRVLNDGGQELTSGNILLSTQTKEQSGDLTSVIVMVDDKGINEYSMRALEEKRGQANSGKKIVYLRCTDRFGNDWSRVAPSVMAGAFAAGADVQIIDGPIGGNTVHRFEYGRDEFRENSAVIKALRGQCGFIGIGEEQARILDERLKEGDEVVVISDGLVAKVLKAKNISEAKEVENS